MQAGGQRFDPAYLHQEECELSEPRDARLSGVRQPAIRICVPPYPDAKPSASGFASERTSNETERMLPARGAERSEVCEDDATQRAKPEPTPARRRVRLSGVRDDEGP